MSYPKKKLLTIARKVEQKKKVTPGEITSLLSFTRKTDESLVSKWVKQLALPLSLAFGFFFHVFPHEFDQIVHVMPSWTNLSPQMLIGVDYLWDVLGEPVKQANILYHIPNIILYSFGIFGIKKLIEAIDRRSWLDRILSAQKTLQDAVTSGHTHLLLKNGHSVLFVGKGDFIGTQFVLNHNEDTAVTIAESKPSYTNIWNAYAIDTLYEDLKAVLERSGAENAGEYFFFPVKDDQIFLPSPIAYDLSPHKLDILCQDIRTIEKENGWRPKRIILVGDKYHKSFVQSEDKRHVVPKSKDTISLSSIAQKYRRVTLLDPTEIVLEKVIAIADGRKIVFRATKEGISEYKTRFYQRLEKMGYKPKRNKKGILTIGYDIFEDQTEQQMLARKVDDYYPVVLSKAVHDALLRNGYKKSEFIYVPDLVLQKVSKTAAEQ